LPGDLAAAKDRACPCRFPGPISPLLERVMLHATPRHSPHSRASSGRRITRDVLNPQGGADDRGGRTRNRSRRGCDRGECRDGRRGGANGTRWTQTVVAVLAEKGRTLGLPSDGRGLRSGRPVGAWRNLRATLPPICGVYLAERRAGFRHPDPPPGPTPPPFRVPETGLGLMESGLLVAIGVDCGARVPDARSSGRGRPLPPPR
jgi:hypothetical protein